jgi:DNA-directed RNA polymerase subunit RPC12/RpoP
LAEKNKDDRQANPKARKAYDACPHCGHELSPWQQVLLTIDRALVCKNCWYRIILDISEDDANTLPPKEKE